MNSLLAAEGRKLNSGAGGLGGGISRRAFSSCFRKASLAAACRLAGESFTPATVKLPEEEPFRLDAEALRDRKSFVLELLATQRLLATVYNLQTCKKMVETIKHWTVVQRSECRGCSVMSMGGGWRLRNAHEGVFRCFNSRERDADQGGGAVADSDEA